MVKLELLFECRPVVQQKVHHTPKSEDVYFLGDRESRVQVKQFWGSEQRICGFFDLTVDRLSLASDDLHVKGGRRPAQVKKLPAVVRASHHVEQLQTRSLKVLIYIQISDRDRCLIKVQMNKTLYDVLNYLQDFTLWEAISVLNQKPVMEKLS